MISYYLGRKRRISAVCDLAVLPLGHPLCAVCLPICGAVQCGWSGAAVLRLSLATAVLAEGLPFALRS